MRARELQKSLDERKRQAGEQRREQAGQVAAWFGSMHVPAQGPAIAHYASVAFIRNESALPVLSVRVFFIYIHAETTRLRTGTAEMRVAPACT
jgi:hypothetical protein